MGPSKGLSPGGCWHPVEVDIDLQARVRLRPCSDHTVPVPTLPDRGRQRSASRQSKQGWRLVTQNVCDAAQPSLLCSIRTRYSDRRNRAVYYWQHEQICER